MMAVASMEAYRASVGLHATVGSGDDRYSKAQQFGVQIVLKYGSTGDNPLLG